MKHTLKNTFLRNRSGSIITICVGLIAISTLMPYVNTSGMHNLDKVAHFLMFFFLSVNIGYKYLGTKKLLPALIGASFLAIGTELIQKFIPERGMDVYDALTDIAGIITGLIVYYLFQSVINKLLIWFWGNPQN